MGRGGGWVVIFEAEQRAAETGEEVVTPDVVKASVLRRQAARDRKAKSLAGPLLPTPPKHPPPKQQAAFPYADRRGDNVL